MDTEFSGFRSKKVTADAENIARIKKLIESEIVRGDGVLSDVDLQLPAILLQMSETGLPHQPLGGHSAGDAHFDVRLKLLRGLVPVLREDLRNRMTEIETLPVSPKAERFDLRDPPDTLFVQVVFQ